MDKKLSTQRGARQKGFTLVELMIALVLGLLVVLAATAMLLSTRSTYRTQDEGTRMQETARFALELVNRVVRMAGYTNFGNGASEVPPFYVPGPGVAANVAGINAKPGSPNYSDSLTISYYGSDGLVLPAAPDGAILDCKGTAVGANTLSTNTFFVALGSDGEPELYCDNGDGGGAQALVRGVQSFQVLYGVAYYELATRPPGTPPVPGTLTTDDLDPKYFVYMRADQMDLGGKHPWGSDWDNIKFIRIGMLVRSGTAARVDLDSTTYQLFGPSYPATGDLGAEIDTTLFSNIERTRLRRVVTSTITLRNRTNQWATLNP